MTIGTFRGVIRNIDKRFREDTEECIVVTEKELKRLNRYQLLELLIMQTTRADQLQAELEEARKELESREIEMENIGSIAEASVQVGGLLEAAQNTADIYLKAVKKRIVTMKQEAEAEAEAILVNARQEAQQILTNAWKRAGKMTVNSENGMNDQ